MVERFQVLLPLGRTMEFKFVDNEDPTLERALEIPFVGLRPNWLSVVFVRLRASMLTERPPTTPFKIEEGTLVVVLPVVRFDTTGELDRGAVGRGVVVTVE